jgi:hypothetical protein
MLHSINIPVHFPHASSDQAVVQGIPLDRTHIRITQTTDPTRPAWHTAKVEIRIDPPKHWELNRDISLLSNPPGLCHVTLRVFDLIFSRFIDVKTERSKFNKTMTVFNAHIKSNADIQDFLTSPGFRMKYLHTMKKDVSTAIWHDLVASPVQKNCFALMLPHMLRIVPESKCDRSKIPTGISVLAVEDTMLTTLGYPPDDTNVGLFSANLNLILMHPRTHIIPITYDLWPNIPPHITDFITPPDCRLGLFLSDVNFVQMADEKELHAMVGRRAWKIW